MLAREHPLRLDPGEKPIDDGGGLGPLAFAESLCHQRVLWIGGPQFREQRLSLVEVPRIQSTCSSDIKRPTASWTTFELLSQLSQPRRGAMEGSAARIL